MNLTARSIAASQIAWGCAGIVNSPRCKRSSPARLGFIRILICILVVALGTASTTPASQHAETETAHIVQTDSSQSILQECSGLTTCSPLMTPTEFAPHLAAGDRGRRTVPATGQAISGRLPVIETPPPQA